MKKIKTLNLNFLFLFLLLTMDTSRQQDHHQQSTVESKGSKYSRHICMARDWSLKLEGNFKPYAGAGYFERLKEFFLRLSLL